MRYFISYTTTRNCSYVLIIVFLVNLTSRLIYADKFVHPPNQIIYHHGDDFLPICDDEYRSKYMEEKIDKESHPLDPPNGTVEINLLPFEISPMEFIPLNSNDSSEFIIHDQSLPKSIFSFRRTSRQIFLNSSRDQIEPTNFKNSNKTKRNFRQGENRKLLKSIRQRKIKIGENSDMGRWKNFSQKSTKEDKNIGSNTNYKSVDTVNTTIDGRPSNNSEEDHKYDLGGWGSECKLTRRIVGGLAVKSRQEFPYMAFIDTGCGGAIIGNMWVLTSAHCILRTEMPKYVYVGSLDLLGGCQYNVDKVYTHPKFMQEDLRNDIGLVTVNPDFTYSPAIKPIALSKDYAHYGMCGIVTGWGAEKYKGLPSDRLLMSTIPIVSKKKCQMFRIKKGQFCAGFKDASSDACQGDSGGPFVVENRVVGIISYGFECAARETPAVYIDIFHYRKWIYRVTGISS